MVRASSTCTWLFLFCLLLEFLINLCLAFLTRSKCTSDSCWAFCPYDLWFCMDFLFGTLLTYCAQGSWNTNFLLSTVLRRKARAVFAPAGIFCAFHDTLELHDCNDFPPNRYFSINSFVLVPVIFGPQESSQLAVGNYGAIIFSRL